MVRKISGFEVKIMSVAEEYKKIYNAQICKELK